MIIILIISILELFIIEKTKTLAPDSAYSTKVRAAQIMKESMNAIKNYRIEYGPPINKVTDPNLTGLIGEEWTPLTTSLGNLSAKKLPQIQILLLL